MTKPIDRCLVCGGNLMLEPADHDPGEGSDGFIGFDLKCAQAGHVEESIPVAEIRLAWGIRGARLKQMRCRPLYVWKRPPAELVKRVRAYLADERG